MGQTRKMQAMGVAYTLYPHARGANTMQAYAQAGIQPLPPRTWGKHDDMDTPIYREPSTPTHVGQTYSWL